MRAEIADKMRGHSIRAGQLKDLPNEMVLLIAEYTEIPTLLRLSATCRRLRAICYLPEVFKIMIRRQQADYLQDTRSEQTECYIERLSQFPRMTTSSWARLATLENALRLVITEEVSSSDLWKANVKLLVGNQTKLLASYHPCLQDENFWLCVRNRNSNYELDRLNHYSFSLRNLALLQIGRTLCDGRRLFHYSLSDPFLETPAISLAWLEDGYVYDSGMQSLFKALSNTIYLVRSSGRLPLGVSFPSMSTIDIPQSWRKKAFDSDSSRNVAASPTSSQDVAASPTSSQDVAAGSTSSRVIEHFSSLIRRRLNKSKEKQRNKQAPIDDRSKLLKQSQLYQQVFVPNAISFLTSGTWLGYEVNAKFMKFNPQQRLADQAMRNIRFRTIARRRSNVEVRCMDAIDKFGEFGISLEVSERDGLFRGRKFRKHSVDWRCCGTITPFGLFAFWGRDLNSYDGFVWLWKEA